MNLMSITKMSTCLNFMIDGVLCTKGASRWDLPKGRPSGTCVVLYYIIVGYQRHDLLVNGFQMIGITLLMLVNFINCMY